MGSDTQEDKSAAAASLSILMVIPVFVVCLRL
jgi:hypothetical protein